MNYQNTQTACLQPPPPPRYLVFMPNRLADLRLRAGFRSQGALAARVATSQQHVARLEKSERLSADWVRKLAPVLDCALQDLLTDGPFSIPITHRIAFAFGDAAAAVTLPAPHAHVAPPPGMDDTEGCFAATVDDDSASGLYPAGSTVIMRHLPPGPVTLALGTKVVVAHFATTRGDGHVMEVLVGRLDRTHDGEFVVLLRHSDRRATQSVTIRRPASGGQMSDRFVSHGPAALSDSISYVPEDADTAEILGVVEMAITPELVRLSNSAEATAAR